jgi:hypothetical protein
VLCRAGKRHGKGGKPHGKAFAMRRRTAKSARQCTARQRILCRAFSPHRTATPFAVRLSLCRASNFSAVPYSFAVRPSPLPCVERCRASFPVAVCGTLPCVLHVAVGGSAAVWHALPCGLLCRASHLGLCRAPSTSTHGKELVASTVPALEATGDSHVASLPCVVFF